MASAKCWANPSCPGLSSDKSLDQKPGFEVGPMAGNWPELFFVTVGLWCMIRHILIISQTKIWYTS